MSDYEEYFNENDNKDSGQKYDSEIFKKWFRFKDKQGFLSVKPFLEAGRFMVDIGEKKGDSFQATPSYVNAVILTTMLEVAASGRFMDVYGNDGFVSYGGSRMNGKPVSRVFKVVPWGKEGNYDMSAFNFKNGMFNARESGNGAFVPDMGNPISVNMIKITLEEVMAMAKRCNLALINFASKHEGDLFASLNGENRD